MINRRNFMQHTGGMGALGLWGGSSFFSQLQAAVGPTVTKKRDHKSMIIIWMNGGAAVKDFWDLKPGHANNWGETTKTKASGIEINALLPKIAEQMKDLSIIRSNTKTEGDHNRGTILTSTGRAPSVLSEWPSMGSMLGYLNKDSDVDLPSFISVGGANGARGPGFLGMKFAPFTVQQPGQLPENIRPASGVTPEQMERRASIFSRLEEGFQNSTKVDKDAAKAHQEVYEKALSLVVSKNKDVFTIGANEPMAAEYGTSAIGKGCLLARKLVEAGTSCVVVNSGMGWDDHGNIKTAFNTKLPQFDAAVASLVKDLKQRGLYQDVVITMLTEFDRTPRINQNGGRDHWPRTNSVLLGGGNIKGGVVYGATNEAGDAIKDNPVPMADLYATYFAALGIKPDTQVRDNLGRPSGIAGDKAKVIAELVG